MALVLAQTLVLAVIVVPLAKPITQHLKVVPMGGLGVVAVWLQVVVD